MRKVYYLDGTVESADWIKQTWDVTHSDEEERLLVLRIEDMDLTEVRRLLALPAYRVAPARIIAALHSRERELTGLGI